MLTKPAIAIGLVLALGAAFTVVAATPAGAAPITSAQIVPIGPDAAGGINDVACSSASYCLAVTYGRQLEAFVNGTLTQPPTLPGNGFFSVFAVACPTDDTCYAVGAIPNPASPSVGEGAVYTITDGAVANPVAVTDTTALNAIVCDTGTTTCTAAGADGGVGAITELSNGSPTGASTQAPGSKSLSGIACPADGDCIAVGTTSNFLGVVVAYTSGTAAPAQVITGAGQVRSVACESTTQCWATAGRTALPIVNGVAGTPLPVAGVSELDGATCPSTTLCYLSGTFAATDNTPQQGGTLAITSDTPAAFQPDTGIADLAAITCLTTTECLGGGSEFVGPSTDHEGVLVLNPQGVAPPTVNNVSFLGTGTSVRVVVGGSGFGDWTPAPNPSTPLTCVAGDTSYDYDAGVLGFTDTTGGWSAGTAGSCVGLVVESWSDDEVVLGFGNAYSVPYLAPGDAFSVSVLGTTYTGTAAVGATPLPTVSTVSFAVSGATVNATITGTNLGKRPSATSPGNLTCVAGDTSADYPTGVLSLADTTQGWTAGAPGSCLGIRIASWSATKITLALGLYYRYVTLVTGDAYQLELPGAQVTGTATVTGGPVVNAVAFSGTAKRPVVTITGSQLGPRPTQLAVADCTEPSGGVFPAGRLQFTDTTVGWNAASVGDCLGWSITSWSATKAVLTFGRAFPNFAGLANGDEYSLTINGTIATGTAVLPWAPTIDAVSFSGSGNALLVTVTGTGFGAKPKPAESPGCVTPDTSHNYASGVLDFSEQSEGWTAGAIGNCIGLRLKSWSDTSVTFQFGPTYKQYGPIQPGDTYQVQVGGTSFVSTAPNPL